MEPKFPDIPEDFIHVGRDENEDKLHFSHLFQYVSAYEPSKERVEDLRQAVIAAMKIAKETRVPQLVDQDGEMFLLCHGGGQLSLCLRWKTYKLLEPDELERALNQYSPVEQEPQVCHYCRIPATEWSTACFASPNQRHLLALPRQIPFKDPYCDTHIVTGTTPQTVWCGLLKGHEGPCEFTRAK